jgi:hypothetical protein
MTDSPRASVAVVRSVRLEHRTGLGELQRERC